MACWLHGVFVGEWLFVFPLCGFSLSLFCNYSKIPPAQPTAGSSSELIGENSSATLFLVLNLAICIVDGTCQRHLYLEVRSSTNLELRAGARKRYIA